MNIEDHNSLIDKALSGKLSVEEKMTFEKLMSQDTFTKEYEFRKTIRDAAKMEGRSQLREQFNQLEHSVKVRKLYPRRMWMAIAASVIILIATIFIIQLYSPDSNDSIYANHYERLENTMVTIQRGENPEDDLRKAFIQYNAKNYEEASRMFEDLIDEYPDLEVYQASILMELGKYTEAIPLLEVATKSENANYYEEAKWYLALAYVKTDQLEKASIILQELGNQDSFYGKKAASLRSELHI